MSDDETDLSLFRVACGGADYWVAAEHPWAAMGLVRDHYAEVSDVVDFDLAELITVSHVGPTKALATGYHTDDSNVDNLWDAFSARRHTRGIVACSEWD